MALNVSPNAPLYGHKNAGMVRAAILQPLPEGTQHNTERDAPSVNAMSRDDFDAKFPRFEKKVYHIPLDCFYGCVFCACCGCTKSDLILDERELAFRYSLCDNPIYDEAKARVPYEKLDPDAGVNAKCGCCKILKYNVATPNGYGSGGVDIAPGCCGCCSGNYINEIATELGRRSAACRRFYADELGVAPPPLRWINMESESDWDSAKARDLNNGIALASLQLGGAGGQI